MKLLHAGHICKHIDVDVQLRLEQNKFSSELPPLLGIIKGMFDTEPMPFSRKGPDDLIKDWNR